MAISLRILFKPTLAIAVLASAGVCNAQDDHGIRRSGVHLSHGYPIPYNSLSYPRSYVGVPPYQIGVNSSGYTSGYSYANRFRYGGSQIYQGRNPYHVAPGRYQYRPNNQAWRY